jgi:hypothetical protein
MKFIFYILTGVVTGGVAILLHQSLPPYGVIASVLLTFLAIWLIGRRSGKRLYKWAAAIGWIAIVLRASIFGTGQELLVQGDGVGSSLLLLGTISALIAIAARN